MKVVLALSTALLAVGPRGHKQIHQLRPGMRTLLLDSGRKVMGKRMVTKRHKDRPGRE